MIRTTIIDIFDEEDDYDYDDEDDDYADEADDYDDQALIARWA